MRRWASLESSTIEEGRRGPNTRLRRKPMQVHFVGLDVHKQVIAFCIKAPSGEIVREGTVRARRESLDQWVATLPGPWHGGMEATMFSHWIYRHLEPHAAKLEMGHAARMKAITAGKKKSDKIDARTIADLLRCNLFPACFVISPELGALRQQLRFRGLLGPAKGALQEQDRRPANGSRSGVPAEPPARATLFPGSAP